MVCLTDMFYFTKYADFMHVRNFFMFAVPVDTSSSDYGVSESVWSLKGMVFGGTVLYTGSLGLENRVTRSCGV
jgi:hypothetical protein